MNKGEKDIVCCVLYYDFGSRYVKRTDITIYKKRMGGMLCI